MLRPVVTPALDPLAHRAAMDALEAQRGAYRRYAQLVGAQQARLTDGDGARAAAFAEEATRGFDALAEGARGLEPLLDRVRGAGTADQVREREHQMEALMHDARQAELAIRNLAVQLEAWRDAYGRQLAEVGLEPGGLPEADTVAPSAAAATPGYPMPGYGPRGRSGDRRGIPSLLDRKG